MARERGGSLKWIGAATGIVSLVLGVNQLTRLVSEVRERQRQVAELRAVADEQQRASDFPAAWQSLDRALAVADQGGYLAKLTGRVGALRSDLREAQENLAMAWLEDVRIPEGRKFSDVVDPLIPIVTRGALNTSEVRKADLLSHVGWAYFLKSRDGGGNAKPDEYYRQALDIDSRNPYAHVHWGHWIVWNRGRLDEATEHFAAAIAAGREREYVRRVQLAALRNSSSPPYEAAFLRAVHDMVENKERIDGSTRNNVYASYFFAFNSPDGFGRLNAALPPADQLAMIRALFSDPDFDESKTPLRDASIAILEEAAGNPAGALERWRALRARLPDGDSRVAERANQEIKRLASRK